jgi:lipopolysaccharide transport system permease protein
MAITSASNPATSKHEPQVVFIKPSKGWVSLNLRSLWEYRELLYFLTWRDIKVR